MIVCLVTSTRSASSKLCHCCKDKLDEMPLSVGKWDCPMYGASEIDRDINTARNIRDEGILKLKVVGQSFLLMDAASDSILSTSG